MDKRLDTLYQLILQGQGLVDVGTDHGYIPVRLALEGYQGHIIASDLREGPLASARGHAAEFGVEDKISFLLCDGLDDRVAEQVDTILIAGMGGDTICGILDRAEWCMSPNYTLILQPMTKAEVLRYWLVNNGFAIERELLVQARDTLYQILAARFRDTNTHLNDGELFTGSFDIAEDRALFLTHLRQQIKRFRTGVRGMSGSSGTKQSPQLCLWKEILTQLEEMEEKERENGR